MNDALPLFDSFLFRALLGFVLGGIFGSFGTMLAYRLPRRLSIIRPRSHCPSCQTVLTARDLIPLFSWLLTRGKCRHCGATIGRQYVLIEATCAVLCALATIALIEHPFVILMLYAAITAGCTWAVPKLLPVLGR